MNFVSGLFLFFFSSFNDCIGKSDFPTALTLAVIRPIYEKDSKHKKENYIPCLSIFVLSYQRLSVDLERVFLLDVSYG